jgi:hypothetical protein
MQQAQFCLLPASSWFLAWITLQPEGGGDMFLQNIGWLSINCTALHPWKQNSSLPLLWEPPILQVCIICDILLLPATDWHYVLSGANIFKTDIMENW